MAQLFRSVNAISERMLDVRAGLILDLFGSPSDWSDVQAIMLCPLGCLGQAYRHGCYLAVQGRHATNLIEGMGRAVRFMHYA